MATFVSCGGLLFFFVGVGACGALLDTYGGKMNGDSPQVVMSTVTVTVTRWMDVELLPKSTDTRSRTPRPTPRPRRSGKPASPGTDPRFPTCAAANAAGYGPYTQDSDPEYHWYPDEDADGVVCAP